jgi:hypothetical protein
MRAMAVVTGPCLSALRVADHRLAGSNRRLALASRRGWMETRSPDVELRAQQRWPERGTRSTRQPIRLMEINRASAIAHLPPAALP